MSETIVCPLCGQAPDRISGPDVRWEYFVACPRCGRFQFSVEALDVLPSFPDKYLLSHVCRTWSGDGLPVILSKNMAELARRAPIRSNPEKRDWLLELMGRRTAMPGSVSRFDARNDYPLVTAQSPDEVAFLMNALANAKLLAGVSNATAMVTMEGWERISQLRQAGPNSAFAFVAMSFAPEMNQLFDEAIAPAVRQAGYEPFRVDRKEHANSIDDEIIGNIRKSRFMVADFTGNRAGVYFEAGMMNGLGRSVIWMCDEKELNHVHFDVRQRNFIDWNSHEDARQRLYKRIVALEGEGPNVGARS